MQNDNNNESSPTLTSSGLRRRLAERRGREEGETQESASPSRERHRASSHRSEEQERWHGRDPRKKVWIAVLSVALIAETCALIVAYTQMMMAENERRTLTVAIQSDALELKTLQPQFVSLKQEVARLVKARSPALRPLQLDHVIPVNSDNVVNITFTATGKDDSKTWEYKAVMANETTAPAYIRLDLLLFDEGGVQIGRSQLLRSDSKDGTDPMLHAGEVRSFYGSTQLDSAENPPVYFTLARRAGRFEQASARPDPK